jgi:uncharacterized repeat protein (TIGR02543 family)/prepilin-type N-terminal cleavage/methylation domain-containing protein
MKKRQLGFTLIEIIVAVAIIAAVASISVVSIRGVQSAQRSKVLLANQKEILAAVMQYKKNTGSYPANDTEFNALLSNPNYFSSPPINPFYDGEDPKQGWIWNATAMQVLPATASTASVVTRLLVTLSGDQAVAINQLATINANITGGTGPYTYSWNIGTSTTNTDLVGWAVPGKYGITCMITDSTGAEAISSPWYVQVYVPLTASVHGPLEGIVGRDYSFYVTVAGGKTPYTYNWNIGGTNSTTSGSFNTPGTNAVICTVTDALGSSITATLPSITIYSVPTLTLSGPIIGKLNTSYTFTASFSGGKAPYNCTWSNVTPDTQLANSQTAVGLWSSSGAKVVTCVLTDAMGQTVTRTATITIWNPPTIVLDGMTDGKINTPYTFTANVTGASPFTYVWTNATGSGSSASNTWASAGAQIVSCKVTDALGQTATASRTITLYTAPTLTISLQGTATEGLVNTQYTFIANVSGGKTPYIYTWSGVTGNSATGSGNWMTPGTKTITCTITDDLSQTATATKTFVVYSVPTVTITGGGSGKKNTNYTFTANVTGGKTPYTYVWTGISGTTASVTGNWNTSGTKTVQVTVTDALGQIATSTATIIIYDAPTVNVVGPDRGKQSTSYQYSASVVGGMMPYTLTWTNATANAQDNSVASASFATAGTYTITCSVTDFLGQTGSSSQTIVISNAPSSTMSGPNTGKINTPYTFTMNVTGGLAPYSYLWTNATGSGDTAVAQFDYAGSKTVSCVVTDALGQTTNASAVIVISSPLNLDLVGPATGKINTSYTFTATASGGLSPYTYSWTNATGTAIGTAYFTSPGSKDVTCVVTDALGQTATKTATIVIAAVPTVTVSGPDTGNVSTLLSFTATVTGGLAPYTYSWTNATGLTNTATAIFDTEGIKSITCTVTDALGQNAGDSVNVNILSGPSISILSPTGGALIGGTTYSITWDELNLTQGFIRIYFWNGTDWDSLASNIALGVKSYSWTVPNPTVDMTGCQIKIVNLVDTQFAAQALSATFDILSYNTPMAVITGPSSGTVGTNYEFTCVVTGGQAPYVYQWNTGASSTYVMDTAWANPGNYTISCTVTDHRGQVTVATKSIIITSRMVVVVASSVPSGILNMNYSFTASVSGGTAPYTFSWTGATLLSSSEMSSIAQNSWSTSGAYDVTCTVMDALGQVGSNTVHFSVFASLTINVNPLSSGTVQATPSGYLYNSGTMVTITAIPIVGYRFVGWTGDVNTTSASTTVLMSANRTVTANFTPNDYAIIATAGANGTIDPSGVVYVNNGDIQTFTMTPNTGYHISSLAVDSSPVAIAPTYTFSNISASHMINVGFDINKYTLTYNAGAGGTISGATPQTVDHGSDGTVVTAIPNTGYHFVSWSDNGSTNPLRQDKNVIADLTTTATFAINTYTITSSTGANGTISPLGATTVNYGANQSYTITPNAHYHIATVTVDGTTVAASSPYVFNNVTADHTIAVTFAMNTYTITTSATSGGSISPSGTITVNEGDSKTFTMTPVAGNHISLEKVDGTTVANNTSYTFTNVTANHTIDVTFAANVGNITIAASGHGTVSPTSASLTYGGSSVGITATADPGYHFTGWAVTVNSSYVSIASPSSASTNITATGSLTDGGTATVTATFVPNVSGTITIAAGTGGTVLPTSIASLTYGAAGTAIAATANTGYTFSNWTVTTNPTYVSVASPSSASTTITSTTSMPQSGTATVTANFTINTYTITFDSQGGSTVTALTGVPYNTTITAPTAPTRTGYTFSGWYKEAACTNAWTFATDTVTTNITLYAKWTINTYTVTFDKNSGNTEASPASITTNYNTTVTLPTAPTKTGYTFTGWNTLANGSGTAFTSSTPVVASITVYAQWTINSYTLTYTAGANGTITGITPQTVSYGGSGTAVTAVPNAGYHFVNWSDGVLTAARTDTNVSASISVTATFAANVSGTITIVAGTGGTVSPTSIASLTYGAAGVTITATPSTGYCFVSWSVTTNPSYITISNSTSATATISATSSMPVGGTATVTATFAINTYTVTFDKNGGDTEASPASITTNYNTTVTLPTAPTKTGYTFTGWNTLANGSGTAFTSSTPVVASITVYAQWTINYYTVTFVDWDNTVLKTQSVAYLGSATPPADPTRSGYTFGGWDGTYTGVTSTRTITATYYTGTSYTISASAGGIDGSGSISPSGTIVVASGSSKTFTITPSSNSSIDHVDVDNVNKGGIDSYTFTNVTANHTIYAYFKLGGGGMAFYNTQCWR